MSRHLLSGKNNNSTDIICISVKYDEWKMNRVIDVKLINPYNNCILGNIIFHQYLSISIGLVDQMGLCFYRLRCEVFQNLILRLMNTGFVRPAVATVLTVYGIETDKKVFVKVNGQQLQQYLPFTVLKLKSPDLHNEALVRVATVLTVYGIETFRSLVVIYIYYSVATVLTVYGIETYPFYSNLHN